MLTSFCQRYKSVDEWYNSVQAQISLAKYPQETANIMQRDIFWFILHDKDFVSKTINEGSVDLEKSQLARCASLPRSIKAPRPLLDLLSK